MKLLRCLFTLVLLLCGATAAIAGPPYLTDDPEPTETGHWEIYAPLVEAAGRGKEFDGAAGAEINYGAAPDLQLTLGLPLSYRHDTQGWRIGAGDVKVSAKYRVYNNEASGVQIAVFPGISIPTGGRDFTAGKVTALLPIWVQKDTGSWSFFGGGGYALNPGVGNRNYWTGGAAISRHFGARVSLGVEANRSGPDVIDGSASTRLGVATIIQLKKPFRLLASGGPSFDDGGGKAGFHIFFAIGLDY